MREDWYVVPARFALRLSNMPDNSDEEPVIASLPEADEPKIPEPKRKLPRRAPAKKNP